MTEAYMYSKSSCEERKRQFLNDYIASGDETKTEYCAAQMSRGERFFSDVLKIEEKFGKDFYSFNADETEFLLSSCVYKYSFYAVKRKLSLLRGYVRWCSDCGYIEPFKAAVHPIMDRRKATEVAATSDADNCEDVIDEYAFSSEAEFIDYIETMFDHDRYLMHRVLAYLLFMGFSAEEIIDIKRSEVDTDAMTVRSVKFQNELMFGTIVEALHADTYYSANSYSSANETDMSKMVPHTYTDSPYLIRSTKAKKIDERVNIAFAKKLKYFENEAAGQLPVTSWCKNIRISGRNVQRLRALLAMREAELENGADFTKQQYQDAAAAIAMDAPQYKNYVIWRARISK